MFFSEYVEHKVALEGAVSVQVGAMNGVLHFVDAEFGTQSIWPDSLSDLGISWPAEFSE